MFAGEIRLELPIESSGNRTIRNFIVKKELLALTASLALTSSLSATVTIFRTTRPTSY